jgi:hypothetical protein
MLFEEKKQEDVKGVNTINILDNAAYCPINNLID